jgi:hypothetical protein
MRQIPWNQSVHGQYGCRQVGPSGVGSGVAIASWAQAPGYAVTMDARPEHAVTLMLLAIRVRGRRRAQPLK